MIHAEAGLIHRSASEAANADRGRHYQDLPLSVADTNASLHGLVGLLAAVIHRQTTGKGQHIDIAMIDATVATDDKIHYDLEASWETAPLRNEIYDLPHGPVLLSTDFRLLFKRLVELGYIEDPSAPSDSFDEKVAKRREAAEAFLQSLETEAAFDAVMQAMNFAWGGLGTRSTHAIKPRFEQEERLSTWTIVPGGYGRSPSLPTDSRAPRAGCEDQPPIAASIMLTF